MTVLYPNLRYIVCVIKILYCSWYSEELSQRASKTYVKKIITFFLNQTILLHLDKSNESNSQL